MGTCCLVVTSLPTAQNITREEMTAALQAMSHALELESLSGAEKDSEEKGIAEFVDQVFQVTVAIVS